MTRKNNFGAIFHTFAHMLPYDQFVKMLG